MWLCARSHANGRRGVASDALCSVRRDSRSMLGWGPTRLDSTRLDAGWRELAARRSPFFQGSLVIRRSFDWALLSQRSALMHARPMIHLVSCPSCARHIRVEEPACPFCGLTFERASRSEAGVASWYAVAALSATLALSGCDSSGNRVTAQAYGGPPGVDIEALLAPRTTDSGVAPPSRESMQIYGAPPVPIAPSDNDR
jgi:hypothetical protein